MHRPDTGDLQYHLAAARDIEVGELGGQVHQSAFANGDQLVLSEHLALADPPGALEHRDNLILVVIVRTVFRVRRDMHAADEHARLSGIPVYPRDSCGGSLLNLYKETRRIDERTRLGLRLR